MNIKSRLIRRVTLAAAAAMLQLYGFAVYYAFSLPDSYYICTGTTLEVDTLLHIDAAPTDPAVQTASVGTNAVNTETLKLFGVIPIKEVEVQQVDRPMLVPCGQAFGIKLRMGGAMVVGMDDVETTSGERCPAQETGIQTGDLIQSVDGVEIDSNRSLQEAVEASGGEAVTITLLRGEETLRCTLTPAYASDDNRYEAGVWVRDSSAGIGTLTYYDPASGTFGGLGHPVCDVDTGDILPVSSGEACGVTITEVQKGMIGEPGMLQGTFSQEAPLGTLSCNNRCGIFGTLKACPTDAQAIPMGFKQEIVIGEAEILCTVDGDTPKRYTAEIEEIDYHGTDSTRNMTIRITDPALLSKTGGIVQGMSGSPIIQNGRIVGAVTHVFVDDPSQGYGIFCENMVRYGISGS